MTRTHAPSISFLSAAFAIILLAALGAASIWNLFDGPGSPREEVIAKTPDLSLTASALKRLPGDLRFFLARHYALKDEFIGADATVKFGGLGRKWTQKVIAGDDGFLFLREGNAIAMAQGRDDGVNFSAWRTHFRSLNDAMQTRNTPFALIIAPNKHTAYADYLPGWIVGASGEVTKRIVTAAGDELAAGAIDATALIADLRATTPDALFYHRTDTHWTEDAAAAAMQAALEPLGIKIPTPQIIERPAGVGGDLARLAGLPPRDGLTTPFIVRSAHTICRTPDGARLDAGTIDPLPIRDFSCENSLEGAGRALIFMDSFGMAAVPTLAAQFQESRFVWQDHVDLDLLDAYVPDYVIQIIAERKLPSADPTDLLRGGKK